MMTRLRFLYIMCWRPVNDHFDERYISSEVCGSSWKLLHCPTLNSVEPHRWQRFDTFQKIEANLLALASQKVKSQPATQTIEYVNNSMLISFSVVLITTFYNLAHHSVSQRVLSTSALVLALSCTLMLFGSILLIFLHLLHPPESHLSLQLLD